MRNQHLTITAVFSVCKDNCLHSPAEISPYLSAAGQRSRRAARVCCGLIGSSVCVFFSSTLTLKPSLLNFTAWTHQERVLSAKSTRAFLTETYHLRQLRKFRVSPTILKTFYAGTIESVLTQCISVWYGNSSSQDCKALQRVVRLAERISGSALPSLQDIYIKRCRSRAVKITKDSNHPGNCLFTLLPSGKRFRSLMAKTERLRRSFFPTAIRLLNSNSAS